MKISSFFYLIGQGLKNIRRNKLFSIASIATIAACIFLFGIFYSILANFQYMMKSAESQVAVTVFFDNDTSDERIKQIGEEIKTQSAVDRISYTSAEEAWENYKSEYFGEYEYLAEGFKDDNPLANSASYSVYLNDTSKQTELVTYIEGIDGVRQVKRSDEVARNLSSMTKIVGYVSVAIIIILLAVSIFLITNTIILGITVRKEEITIMKYVGATDGFVEAPFFVEGLTIGLIGAAVPVTILYFLYNNIIGAIASKFSLLSSILTFLPAGQVFAVLIPVSLVLGLAIGFLGSFFALRKHANV